MFVEKSPKQLAGQTADDYMAKKNNDYFVEEKAWSVVKDELLKENGVTEITPSLENLRFP